MAAPNIETIVSLSKRRGFVFPSSEIYGGLGSAWDYGPLGVELANNVKRAWWRWLVYERDDIEGMDSSIILNRLVWKYSEHEATFNDPLVDCRKCKSRFRADKLVEEFGSGEGADLASVACPKCGATRLDGAAPLQPDASDTTRRGRRGGRPGRARLSAARDGAGHLHQLPERADDDAPQAPLRHRADRQDVSATR